MTTRRCCHGCRVGRPGMWAPWGRGTGRRLAYVGALGPAHRREWLLEQASERGMPATDPIARNLRGPIGLDLGDRSPVGIAVAITAEILAQFNRRPALSLHAHVAA